MESRGRRGSGPVRSVCKVRFLPRLISLQCPGEGKEGVGG